MNKTYAVIETKTFEKYLNTGKYENCPKQKFLAFVKDKVVAIDNTQGEFFTEEFDSLEKAREWLK